tara:strand:+ start:253 stop:642 length:390 start_codon:yes stop_codon:yes gene_type:complete
MTEVKYLKLTNGEQIVVSSNDDFKDYKSKKYIEISDPIEIKAVKVHHGHQIMEHYTMQPWIKMAKTEKIVLPTDSILLAVDLHDDAIMQYKEYIKDAVEIELVKEDELELESEDEFYGDTDEKPRKIIH